MNRLMILPLATATAMVGACASTGSSYAYDDGGYGYYDRNYYDQNGRYDWDRPDPRHGGYYADDYYKNDRRYRERRLGNNDRIYRGRDNKYYCRRNDGTTGLIVGGAAGALLGREVDRYGDRAPGTIIGGAAGALIGREIDRGGRC